MIEYENFKKILKCLNLVPYLLRYCRSLTYQKIFQISATVTMQVLFLNSLNVSKISAPPKVPELVFCPQISHVNV